MPVKPERGYGGGERGEGMFQGGVGAKGPLEGNYSEGKPVMTPTCVPFLNCPL